MLYHIDHRYFIFLICSSLKHDVICAVLQCRPPSTVSVLIPWFALQSWSTGAVTPIRTKNLSQRGLAVFQALGPVIALQSRNIAGADICAGKPQPIASRNLDTATASLERVPTQHAPVVLRCFYKGDYAAHEVSRLGRQFFFSLFSLLSS
jgi:hypothetical protein